MWSLRRPRRRRLVYFGATGVDQLRNYIAEDDAVVYVGPRREPSIWVLLYAVFRGWWSIRGYYGAFLRLVRPDVVVTSEDNAVEFYFTKRYRPETRTICLQNGRRDSFSHDPDETMWDILRAELPRGAGPDVVLTHGAPWSAWYREALGEGPGRIVAAGNLKNNAFPLGERRGVRRLLFVSSFPNLGADGDLEASGSAPLGHWRGHPVTLRDFYAAEGVVAALAAGYARTRGIPFAVVGKRPDWQKGERRYFEAALRDHDWSYIPAAHDGSSYAAVTPDDVLVNIDSTFGYEMMSRDVRVAFVAARMPLAGLHSVRDCEFAHPYVDVPTGPFWTNVATRDEVSRVIDAVTARSNRELCADAGIDMGEIFVYDRGNTTLCEVLDEFGVKNRGPRVVG